MGPDAMSNSYYECACCSYITDDFDAIQRHMAEQHTGRAADLASVVTRQRSEIDTLRALAARLNDRIVADTELLAGLWARCGGAAFVQADGSLHPGIDAQMAEVAERLGIGQNSE